MRSSLASTPTTSALPDYAKLHTALKSNSLVESAASTIPKLTGRDNYGPWSDRVLTLFKYCGIDNILTGVWTVPAATPGDTTSEENAREWCSLDLWIQLSMNLSDGVWNQVRHLATSNEQWLELEKLYRPATTISFHFLSIINVRFDGSTRFEDFVASKREHNRLLGELGGHILPDTYIAIIIRYGFPEHLHKTVAHIPDDEITTYQLVDIIRSVNKNL